MAGLGNAHASSLTRLLLAVDRIKTDLAERQRVALAGLRQIFHATEVVWCRFEAFRPGAPTRLIEVTGHGGWDEGKVLKPWFDWMGPLEGTGFLVDPLVASGVRLGGRPPIVTLPRKLIALDQDWVRYSTIPPLPGCSVKIADLLGTFYRHWRADEVRAFVLYRNDNDSAFTEDECVALHFFMDNMFWLHTQGTCPLSDGPGTLSRPRQRIIELARSGLNVSSIAHVMKRDESTIRFHVKEMCEDFGADGSHLAALMNRLTDASTTDCRLDFLGEPGGRRPPH